MKKLNITLVGRRNAGKSSLLNCLTGQYTAIVSDTPGTTTDPVKKSYEIPGYATLVFTDTAGIDDKGEIGRQRINKTYASIRQADLVLFVITGNQVSAEEEEALKIVHSLHTPFLFVHNQSDLVPLSDSFFQEIQDRYSVPVLSFSALLSPNVAPLIQAIQAAIPAGPAPSLLEGLVKKGDWVLLVTPIDREAPTGRLILPQVQVLRNLLDLHAIGITLQPEEIPAFLSSTPVFPSLVITDSQVFKQVAALIPTDIPLTSFSIIFARHKGNFDAYKAGTRFINHLQEGDRILILESCSHQSSCEDIGRVKLPALLQKYTGKKLNFDFIAGLDSIDDSFSQYALVIQCGGCMSSRKQLQNRISLFIQAGIPVSNYGMALAFLNGIFERSILPFNQSF